MVLAEDAVDVVALVEEDDVVAVVQVRQDVVADVRVQHVLHVTRPRGKYLVVEDDDRGEAQALARQVVRAGAVLLSVLAEVVQRVAVREGGREQQHLEGNLEILRRRLVALVECADVLDIEGGSRVVGSPLRVANLAMAGILR